MTPSDLPQPLPGGDPSASLTGSSGCPPQKLRAGRSAVGQVWFTSLADAHVCRSTDDQQHACQCGVGKGRPGGERAQRHTRCTHPASCGLEAPQKLMWE